MQLCGLTEARAVEALVALGARPKEARRLWSAAVKGRAEAGVLRTLPQVRKDIARAALERFSVERLSVVERRRDPGDGFVKYLFGLPDGLRVEAVRIPIFDRHYVVCVSSQAGCALECRFCATGRMGLQRNLETWEIVEQVLSIRAEADRPIRGVVFMGMGEPLQNYARVIDAARILSAPAGVAIAARNITLSTVGLVPQIRRYTAEAHPYRLAFSLSSAIPEKREALLPIEARWPLRELWPAIADYGRARRTRVMLAYVLIRGFNTGEEDARALAELVGDTPVIIDLIDVNDATGRFLPPNPAELNAFRDALRQHLGQPVARRYSGGKAVDAACGMLAAS